MSPGYQWLGAQSGTAWTESWYDGEQRLRAYQRTYYAGGGRRTQLAEYRYDPLGRRIMVRTRVDTLGCPTNSLDADCQATTERFYWDGDQLVYEERGPGEVGLATYLLEGTGGPNAFYGSVHYLHGAGLDTPLSMRHGGLGSMVLHRNWRGLVTGATSTSGTGVNSVVWPGAYRDAFHAPDLLRTPPPAQTAWIGSLAEDQRDVTGLTYRRNRYYDATSGRFTQSDPIGLVGGMNTYAFAGGDPVSYSDPFGLCPTCGDAAVDYYADVAARSSSSLTRLGANVGLALASLWTSDTWKETASTLASVAPVGRLVGTFKHFGFAEDAAKFANGLREGSFATNRATSIRTGAEAVESLSLPGRGTVPNATYRVTPEWWRYVEGPNRVAPKYGQPGGGWEYRFPSGTGPGTVSAPRAIFP